MDLDSAAGILKESARIALGEVGGTLATMHAEDGTPYVTFVLFHLTGAGEIVFGSAVGAQHERNMQATPEVSFLIDNRAVIESGWDAFTRVVIEGRAEIVEGSSAEWQGYVDAMAAKHEATAYFAERGPLYRIRPRRLVLMRGLEATRHIVDFEHGG